MSPVWKIGEVMGPMGGNRARFMSQLSSIDFCPYISETIGPCLKSELDCYGAQNTTKSSNSCGVGDHPSAEQIHDQSELLKSATPPPPTLNLNLSSNLRVVVVLQGGALPTTPPLYILLYCNCNVRITICPKS